MAYVKDLWVKTVRNDDGTTSKVKTARHGGGKRWLAGWVDPDGRETSKSFERKVDAETHAKAMETDVSRGDYLDPEAGKVLFGTIAKRWLGSRIVDPASGIRYESVYRLHLEETFARRQVKNITPSEVQAWIGDLAQKHGPSTIITGFLILQGVLELAVADEAIKKNPAKSPIIQVPKWVGKTR